jgi:hypothetical protein
MRFTFQVAQEVCVRTSCLVPRGPSSVRSYIFLRKILLRPLRTRFPSSPSAFLGFKAAMQFWGRKSLSTRLRPLGVHQEEPQPPSKTAQQFWTIVEEDHPDKDTSLSNELACPFV